MKKHYVEYLSPGTFVSETRRVEVDNHDVAWAMEHARTIKERHGATPFGFRFITRERSETELDAKVTYTSGMYYLGGKVRTLAEVDADDLPDEDILRSNMRNNRVGAVITNTNSWKATLPFMPNDTRLEWTP